MSFLLNLNTAVTFTFAFQANTHTKIAPPNLHPVHLGGVWGTGNLNNQTLAVENHVHHALTAPLCKCFFLEWVFWCRKTASHRVSGAPGMGPPLHLKRFSHRIRGTGIFTYIFIGEPYSPITKPILQTSFVIQMLSRKGRGYRIHLPPSPTKICQETYIIHCSPT